jgi:VIT1/CCC1 family predicted Fe2+/Mn2+ transporter
LQGEIGLERAHIRDFKKEEIKEVTALLELIGIPAENTLLRNQLISHYESDSEALLKVMVALEFGVVDKEERSPLIASLASGLLYCLGSLPSLLPFVSRDQSSSHGLMLASLATISCLLLVGGVKTWATRGNCATAAIENLLIAGLGGILAYSVGMFFDRIVH